MATPVSQEDWLRYRALLPQKHDLCQIPLPTTLPYQGTLRGSVNYIPPESLLRGLREWLENRGERSVCYFLTEYVREEEGLFEVEVSELTERTLANLNANFENVITAKDFSWALFIDHEGGLHVAGPAELFSRLQALLENTTRK